MKTKIIELKNITVGYFKHIVLENANLEVYNTDFIAIVGPNGAGKTTLIRTILRKLKVLDGEVVYYDKISFGYVPQIAAVEEIFPFTVNEVIQMGLYHKLKFLDKKDVEDAINEVLDYFDLRIFEDKIFRELSGGLKRRVLLARALCSNPEVLVLDEPTANLDIISEHSTMQLIKRIHKEKNKTILLATHHLNTVINYAEKFCFIKDKKLEVYNKEDLTEKHLQELFETNLKLGNGRIIIAG
jgi:ABC-type Mn2+/Zn2+ transport system ATPase subunit